MAKAARSEAGGCKEIWRNRVSRRNSVSKMNTHKALCYVDWFYVGRLSIAAKRGYQPEHPRPQEPALSLPKWARLH
jgi:hypothetical protein